MNVVMLSRPTGERLASSRCRAPPRAWRSPAASSTRCSRSPRAALAQIANRATRVRRARRRRPDERTTPRLVCASANPDKVAEIEAILARRRRAAAATGRRARRGRGRRHARGQRPAQGRRDLRGDRNRQRSPTTPVSRSRRSAALPACTRRGTPATAARTPTTAPSCCGLSTVPPTGRRHSAPVCWCGGPTVRKSSSNGVCAGTHHRRHRAGRRRIRIRRHLRARRRRRSHVRRDDRRREAHDLASRASVPEPARRAVGLSAARRNVPGVTSRGGRPAIGRSPRRRGRSRPCRAWPSSGRRGRARPAPGRRPAVVSLGAKVRCSSEQNQTAPSATAGLPWSMPRALRPTSATAHPSLTEITVPTTNSACSNGRPCRP